MSPREFCADKDPSAAEMVQRPDWVERNALRPEAVRNHSVVVVAVPPVLGRATSQLVMGVVPSADGSAIVWPAPSVAVSPGSMATRATLPVRPVVETRIVRRAWFCSVAPG